MMFIWENPHPSYPRVESVLTKMGWVSIGECATQALDHKGSFFHTHLGELLGFLLRKAT